MIANGRRQPITSFILSTKPDWQKVSLHLQLLQWNLAAKPLILDNRKCFWRVLWQKEVRLEQTLSLSCYITEWMQTFKAYSVKQSTYDRLLASVSALQRLCTSLRRWIRWNVRCYCVREIEKELFFFKKSSLLAGAEGLEPSTKVLETHVLPLHHTPKHLFSITRPYTFVNMFQQISFYYRRLRA